MSAATNLDVLRAVQRRLDNDGRHTLAHVVEDAREEIVALRKHVTDAAIAAQLTPPTDRQFLDKCERVKEARERMRVIP